jgi:hypothetical protein
MPMQIQQKTALLSFVFLISFQSSAAAQEEPTDKEGEDEKSFGHNL